MESLCLAQRTQCDPERSSCTDSSGTAYCQCRDGYYKHSPDDVSCLGELCFMHTLHRHILVGVPTAH